MTLCSMHITPSRSRYHWATARSNALKIATAMDWRMTPTQACVTRRARFYPWERFPVRASWLTWSCRTVYTEIAFVAIGAYKFRISTVSPPVWKVVIFFFCHGLLVHTRGLIWSHWQQMPISSFVHSWGFAIPNSFFVTSLSEVSQNAWIVHCRPILSLHVSKCWFLTTKSSDWVL